MKNVLFLFIVISLFFILFNSCKKDNGNSYTDEYRVISMVMESNEDSLRYEYTYQYSNNRLDKIEYYQETAEGTVNMNYDTEGNITSIITGFEDDIPSTDTVFYTISNNQIIEFNSTQPYNAHGVLTYSGNNLTEQLVYSVAQEPSAKWIYSYQNEHLITYSRLIYDPDGNIWEEWSRQENVLNGDYITETMIYYAMFDIDDFQLHMKRVYEYEGNTIKKVRLYGYDTNNEWFLLRNFYLNYNQNGYLTEYRSVYSDGENELDEYVIKFTYEYGTGNMSLFNKTKPAIRIYGDYLPLHFPYTLLFY